MSIHARTHCRLGFSGVLAAILMALLGSCESASTPPPVDILGVWMTDAPRHRDRSFEVREDAVVFGTGRFSAPQLYTLVRVEPRPDSVGWKVCRLFYRERDGTVSEIDLEYTAQPKPTLRFFDRKEVWFRSPNQGVDDA
jgi:hypothetical protein